MGAIWILYMVAIHVLAIVGSVVGFIIWEQGKKY